MNREIAEKAAFWWADQLRTPAILDNGDDSEIGAMTMVMALRLQQSERQDQTGDEIDAFESALANLIEGSDDKLGSMVVSVDYHPCHILNEAAATAGLSLGGTTLPWKTIMWIRDSGIEVSCGYGAPVEPLV